MKAIILCAGYATRLYPLTKNIPKPLLPIGDRPIIEYLLKKIENIKEIDEVFVVTNDRFYPNFVSWKDNFKSSKKIKIINDNTSSNEDRLGGLGDLNYVLELEKIDEDIFVSAGDTFFDFDLNYFVNFFKEKNVNCIGLYDLDNLENAKNFGILSLDNKKRIVSYVEKPKNPESSLISTAMYFYTKSEIGKIKEYMKTNGNKDGPGYLIPYFLKSQEVYGYVFEGNWIDIGSKESYEEANKNVINFRD